MISGWFPRPKSLHLGPLVPRLHHLNTLATHNYLPPSILSVFKRLKVNTRLARVLMLLQDIWIFALKIATQAQGKYVLLPWFGVLKLLVLEWLLNDGLLDAGKCVGLT